MSDYTILHGRRSIQVATDRRVIPASEFNAFDSALDCAQSLTDLLDQERARIATAVADARQEGLALGRQDARDEATACVAASVARMAQSVQAHQVVAREAVAMLALAVVGKLSATLGAGQVVPALIQQAVAEMMPARVTRVRVAPGAFDATRQHLDRLSLAADVRADDTLADFDCVIETADGQTVAGLDHQLAAIGDALGVAPALDIELA